jgi:hypothetical protein
MGATKLPRVENVFDLFERKIFVAYRLWNVNIARKSEPRATVLKSEEKPGRQLAQAPFALDLIGVQRGVLLT